MKNRTQARIAFCCVFALLLGILIAGSGVCGDGVSVILKNKSSASVTVELIDQYGGNFTATIDAGMSQSHTLKANSEIKVGGNTVHVVAPGDEGKEIVVAGS